MKKLIAILAIFLLLSCSSTQLVESWKNPDITTYEPYKVLIVGLTSDEAARQQFEKSLKNELETRGHEAVMSLNVLDNTLKTDMMTKDELLALENQLISDGFDTILFTKIIGVEDKEAYRINFKTFDNTYRKFRDDYSMYQDVYYNSNYYDKYRVYHAETSIYCICPTKERELIWKGYININDPRSVKKTVKDYVKLALIVLEEEKLISPKTIEDY